MPIPSSFIETSSRSGSPLLAWAKMVPDLGGGKAYFDRIRDQFRQDDSESKSRVGLNEYSVLGTHMEPDTTLVLGDRP